MTEEDDPFGFPCPGLKGLSGTTAIVTGSTRGIGRGIAQRFAVEGVNTVITGRSVDAGEQVATEIRDEGYTATFIEADMSEPDDIEYLINATVDRYQTVDIVVNNAAAWRHRSTADRSFQEWDHVLNVSLRAPWYLSQLALKHMQSGSSIINVSSIHSVRCDPARFPYNVAKSGLNGLTRAMAIDFGPYGVRANGLIVGNVQKEHSSGDPFDEANFFARLVPVQRRGLPSDVAAIAVFLASSEAGFITGTNIPIDGGRDVCLANPDWPPDENTPADATHTYPDRIPDE